MPGLGEQRARDFNEDFEEKVGLESGVERKGFTQWAREGWDSEWRRLPGMIEQGLRQSQQAAEAPGFPFSAPLSPS